MSTLSELLPSGGGGGSTVDFVASGVLSDGVTVVLKTDGTVEAVTATAISQAIPLGSKTVFNTGQTEPISVSFDPNNTNTFVVAFVDLGNSGKGKCSVGTISGSTITFGDKIIFDASTIYQPSVAFNPNVANQFVVTWRDGGTGNYGKSCVGTVSGLAISYGTEVTFNSAYTKYSNVIFDKLDLNKFVIAYQNVGVSEYGYAIAGSISGTSITYGTGVQFNAGESIWISASFDPFTKGRFVVAYRDGGASNYGHSVIGSLSGTTITFGSEYVFSNYPATDISVECDPFNEDKFIISCLNNTSTYGQALVGTMTGNAIAYGTAVTFNSGGVYWTDIAFDPINSGKFLISYFDNTKGAAISGTISGTSLTFGTEAYFDTGNAQYSVSAFLPDVSGRFLTAYKDYASSNKGTAIISQMPASTTNLTTSNFVGTSTAAYTNAETATIAIQGGLSTNQTGLTIGSTYYVQGDGTFATTADTISVNAGKALSATTLLLKDL